MAIYITKEYKIQEERDVEMAKHHEALVGSPAYVSSEIAITRDGTLGFTLCIGSNNGTDLRILQTY